ncbi:NAD(P)/FAD-dependent oxidoreductase [Sphingobium nicotianae]|uniref:FAD-binding oxidoreductase n=1 Tax=Sphingobium nicotianae TaxID=2782607 RepID=A0A9X1DB06_9SPHN|nr:FAD-binding oxidoreductase [Sphingobium nicotianae]MBT2186634.1 FAD-binding oxidoreductase [Sphingobium nicotianae]
MTSVDILVVGGGMAGFSLAAQLAGHASVLLIEQEAQPAYHASGRSVAFWEESYGGPGVQPLTSASGPLLAVPDPAFADGPLMTPRGAFHVGQARDAGLAEAMLTDFAASGVTLARVERAQILADLPGLREGWTIGLAEPSMCDIDVAGLLGAYRRMARRGGVEVRLSTGLVAARREGAAWLAETSDGAAISCGMIVNAAGAWADDVARRCGLDGLGITPYRRTVVQLRCPQAPASFPLIAGLDGSFYFKAEGAGRIWLSPHDETPDVPHDVAPEELDVAIAIDRFQQVVDWEIEAVEHKWAGLRSFAPDRLPVYGADPRAPGFFWFAGQGGFGIQTAPAAALIGGALALGAAMPTAVAGIDASLYAPGRLVKA